MIKVEKVYQGKRVIVSGVSSLSDALIMAEQEINPFADLVIVGHKRGDNITVEVVATMEEDNAY
jgi:hypothetical protein